MAKETPKEVQKLRAENRQLRAKNKALQSQQSTNPVRRRSFWRTLGIILCTGLAGAILVTGNILFWVGNSVVDSNRYQAIIEPIIKEPEVQSAVATYTTTELYKNVNIQQKLNDSLPEQVKFLAPVLASQIPSATHAVFLKVLQNPEFQDKWVSVQVGAHQRVINFVKNYQGDGTIDVSDIYNQLTSNLQNTKLSFLANKSLPPKFGSITVVDASWLPAAHNIVTNLGLYQGLATASVIVLTAAAVWLSRRRRRLIIRVGILYAVMMFISLVSFKVLQASVVNQVASQYQAAVRVASGHILQPLIMQTRTILLMGLLVSFVAWISGPGRVAASVRDKIQQALNGNLHQALFHSENGFTRWVGQSKRVLQWLSIAVIAIIMLLVQLNPALVLGYGLLMIVVVSVVEVLAAPAVTTKPETVRHRRKQ